MVEEYRIIGNKYQKSGKNISLKQVKKDLTPQQFYRLKKTKLCKIRIKDQEIEKNKKKSKDELLIQSNFNNYKLENGLHKGVKKLELWRKNTKFGYYNFVCYLNSKEEINEAILKDIKQNKDL